jgi:hypothetical protein
MEETKRGDIVFFIFQEIIFKKCEKVKKILCKVKSDNKKGDRFFK